MNITEKIKSDFILSEIIKNFDAEIYLVGGSVRDMFLNRQSIDRDLIVADRNAKEFALELKKFFNCTFIPLDEENKIYRLVMPDKINYTDITNPAGSLEKDLKRRDLTVNAVAVNINTGEIIDLFGGVEDIKNGCLRCIDELNFKDDPLRILRVFRFRSILGFKITSDTFDAVCKYADLINQSAVERINYEILKMFGGKYAHEALIEADSAGALEKLFPFVKELKQVPPNLHHHLDLFHHSVETVKQIQNIYENADESVKKHLESVDFGGFPRIAHLKLAGFMHDIGKFSTWTIEEGGRHRFIKHDDAGSKISAKLLKRMHFSNKQIEYLSTLIKYHIYPSHVMCSPEVTEKIMMRYIRRMDKNSIDDIVLAMADRLSARGPEITDKIVETNINSLKKLLDFYIEKSSSLEPLPKLLDGKDIMAMLNITPSPKLGEILDALHEAQLAGDVLTRDDAILFVKNYRG